MRTLPNGRNHRIETPARGSVEWMRRRLICWYRALVRGFSRRPALGTLALGFSRHVIDRALNVETATLVALARFGLDAPDRVEYEAGGWLDLLRVLRPGAVTADDVFLDLGSGKGRVLLQAAQYRFAR